MKECNLRNSCDKAKTCNSPCPAFISLHGLNNRGGKQGDALLPSEYRQTTYDTARCRKDQADIYKDLGRYMTTFKKAFNSVRNTTEERLKDLFFYSKETGTGKTETASMLLNEFLMYSYLRSVLKEEPGSFVDPIFFLDMPALQDLYLKANRGNTPREIAEDASREYYRRISKAKKSRFVVFDEMAIRDASDAFRTDIHNLVNHRTGENLTSIYTSNLPMKEMLDIYDQRLYDRIRRYTGEYKFLGESKRGVILKNERDES